MEEMNRNENYGELSGFDSVSAEGEKDSFETYYEKQTAPETEQRNVYNGGLAYNPLFNERKPQKKYSLSVVIISVLLAAVVGAVSSLGAMFAVDYFADKNGNSNSPIAIGNGDTVNIDVKDVDVTVVEAVAQKVTPSVVGIRTTVSVTNFFGGTEEASGEGSGVIYTSDGYIITNYHVVADAITSSRNSDIQVFLSDDAETGYPATVVGYNISCDLAVIKINAKNLTSVAFASSLDLKVGQFVVAIGNPGGLEFMGSVTYGVISGLNRIIADSSETSELELIQTDAAINPGNSGGALVNTEGKLIGVNSSKIVSESYEGMGFAIPADTVKDICDKIIAKEYDPDPYIGVIINEKYDADTLKYWGYPVGAVINSVTAGSPADEAGLERGDIITEFNGVKITNYSVFSDVLAFLKPNDTVELKIYRGGREYTGSIKIGSNNSQ